MIVVLLAVLLALGWTPVRSSPACACSISCQPSTARETVERTDVIVHGTVRSVRKDLRGGGRPATIVVAVDHVYKGTVGGSLTIYSTPVGGTCGDMTPDVGSEQLIFATEVNGRLMYGICGAMLQPSDVIPVTGPGVAVVPAQPPSAWRVLAPAVGIAVGAGLLAVLLVVWIVRRRPSAV